MLEIDRIYNTDCLEGMKDIPCESVDMVATDPPYCIGTTSNGSKGSWLDNNLIRPFFDLLFAEVQRCLKDGAHIYINTDWRTYPFLYPLLQKYFVVRNLIVWDYEWMKAGSFYRFSHELIMFATKGSSSRNFPRSEKDVWRIKPINYTNPNKNHQAEKPVSLIEKMILNSSQKDDTVLDMFMGSGTTAVACVNTGRHFIGFEIDEKYFCTAIKRVETAQVQARLDLLGGLSGGTT